MIKEIRLENFKCYKDQRVELRRLSVLTGMNSAGKSTLIQGILLARQAGEDDRLLAVQLNGPNGLALGEAEDVLHADASSQTVQISLSTDEDRDFVYSFVVPEIERYLHLPVASRPSEAPFPLGEAGLSFTYLNAERLGPRDHLLISSEDFDKISIGHQGQYVAQVLTLRERAIVPVSLRHPDYSEVQTLRPHVEAWMSEIVRPIRIDAQWPVGVTVSTLKFQDQNTASLPMRPGNVGFGVSYALPIVTAGLAMQKGILIVENPEAHLHPAAQSKMGRFLFKLAQEGVQVIVETHSDHVVNGIRRAVAESGAMSSDAIVHYFSGTQEPPVAIDISEIGGMSSWPRGFFDQLDEDLGGIARAKRAARSRETDSNR